MDFKLRPFRADRVPPPREPLALDSLRPNYAGFDIELGCGAGMHAIARARACPDRLLLAIERTQAKFEGFESRLKNHDPLPNLIALRDDAIAVVTHALPPQSVDTVFLLYPNPYPKAAQANKRWHQMPFLTQLHAVMKPGAELVLATNESFYADEAKAWLVGTGLFRLVSESKFGQADVGSESFPRARTHFEKKYLNGGQQIFDLRFVAQP